MCKGICAKARKLKTQKTQPMASDVPGLQDTPGAVVSRRSKRLGASSGALLQGMPHRDDSGSSGAQLDAPFRYSTVGDDTLAEQIRKLRKTPTVSRYLKLLVERKNRRRAIASERARRLADSTLWLPMTGYQTDHQQD